jgi:hypothetical protein
MFKRLAKFRHFEPRHGHRPAAAASNDDRPGRRRPALACHWSLVDGTRLECRWQAEGFLDPASAARDFT